MFFPYSDCGICWPKRGIKLNMVGAQERPPGRKPPDSESMAPTSDSQDPERPGPHFGVFTGLIIMLICTQLKRMAVNSDFKILTCH